MFVLSPLLAAWDLFGQRVEASDLAVVGLLVILEGVLSIDNALVLGLLAKRLPAHQRKRALTYGLVGAFAFRVIAICTASLLLQWTFVKFLGGGYLVYIAVRHLFFESHEEGEEKIELDSAGNPILVDKETGGPLTDKEEELEIEERVPIYAKPETRARTGAAAFWPTVAIIELTDVAFAVDSILAAMALAGSRTEKLWVVIAGGILGVVLMRFAAVVFIRLLEKFPRFEVAAYLLVIVIGVKLLADWGFNSDWSFHGQPSVAAKLGTWKESFESLEKSRLKTVDAYEEWLDDHWIFDIPKSEHKHSEEHEPPAEPAEKDPNKVDVPHTPHLLDFHSPKRPEFIVFWTLMAICFGIGFIKPKEGDPQAPAKH